MSSEINHLDNKEVNEAAYSFKKSIELVKSMTNHEGISKKGMSRVLNAMLEFPLGNTDPKFRNKFEEQLFILTLNTLRDKTIMMNAVLANQADTINKLEMPSATNTETSSEEDRLLTTVEDRATS